MVSVSPSFSPPLFFLRLRDCRWVGVGGWERVGPPGVCWLFTSPLVFSPESQAHFYGSWSPGVPWVPHSYWDGVSLVRALLPTFREPWLWLQGLDEVSPLHLLPVCQNVFSDVFCTLCCAPFFLFSLTIPFTYFYCPFGVGLELLTCVVNMSSLPSCFRKNKLGNINYRI